MHMRKLWEGNGGGKNPEEKGAGNLREAGKQDAPRWQKA